MEFDIDQSQNDIQNNILPASIPEYAPKKLGRMSMDEALAQTSTEPKIVPVPAPSVTAVHETVLRAMHKNPDSNKKKSAFTVIGIVLSILVLLAAGLWAGYKWGQHKEQVKLAANTNTSNAKNVAQPGPLYQILNQDSQSQPATTGSVQTQPLSALDDSSKQHPQVLGTSISSPTTTPAPASTAKTYTYSGASIAITIPTSWTITQSEQNGTTLKIMDGSGSMRGQLFIQAGVSETLDQKRIELQANAEVSNINSSTFHGIPALSYVQSGVSGTIIVLEYKGSLYTFSQGAQNETSGYMLKFID